MDIFTRDMNFVNVNNQEMEWVNFNGDIVYENGETLETSGVPPLTVTNSLNKNAIGYQVYGNSKQGKLPNGYTQLEYIATSSSDTVNAYIDTGLYANPNLRINTEVEFIAAKGQASIFRSGADFWSGVYLNGSLKFAYTYQDDTGNYTSTGITAANGIRYNIDFDGKQKTLKINNNTITISGSPATKTSTKTLPLLGRIGGDGTSVYSDFYGKLYRAKIYDNDILARDFIPCKNSSNVVGLYDLVNGVFYSSGGTVDFVAGPEMPNPTNPIEIKSVGDLVTDSQDEHYGKYKIPITVTNSNNQTITTNIYLNAPLRKVGNYSDYIDLETQKVYRNVVVDDDTGTLPIEQSYHGVVDNIGTTIELPDILLNKGTNIISIDTNINASNLWIKYKGKE